MISAYTLFKKNNSDSIGALASGLCLIHCIATPFIFLAQTCSITCCDSVPTWWTTIDFLFMGISFFAVYWSAKHSTILWINYALWVSWTLLCCIIINVKIELLVLPEASIYVPALALIVLHLYNRKYCKCNDDNCCATIN